MSKLSEEIALTADGVAEDGRRRAMQRWAREVAELERKAAERGDREDAFVALVRQLSETPLDDSMKALRFALRAIKEGPAPDMDAYPWSLSGAHPPTQEDDPKDEPELCREARWAARWAKRVADKLPGDPEATSLRRTCERIFALVAGPPARFGEAAYGRDLWTAANTSYRGDLGLSDALVCTAVAKQAGRPSRLVLELDRYDPPEVPA